MKLKIFTLGQGHVVTQPGQIAYHSMRIDEANTLTQITCLFPFLIAKYCKKTVGDLR